MTTGYITPEGLKQLDLYKYKSGAYSKLDNLINPFWEWAVTLLPPTMAPNLVTFIGWIFGILSYGVMLYFDFTFTQNIPRWTFLFATIGMFLYSTLDAIDGKQARRTKSSSPLGQLFDHGCDSFSISFFILAVCEACKFNREETFLIFISGQLAFWTANWMEYHTGVLLTNVGNFGVTECELLCLLIHLFTFCFGQDAWDINLDFLIPAAITTPIYESYPLAKQLLTLSAKRVMIYLIAIVVISLVVYSYLSTVLTAKSNKVQMLGEWLSMTALVIMEIVWIRLPIYDRYSGLILVNFGILMSLLVCKMIICSVTHMKFQYFHREIVLFIVTTLLMLVLDQLGMASAMVIVFWGCFGLNVLTIITFLSKTISEITEYLGIYCFSLEKRPRKKLQ